MKLPTITKPNNQMYDSRVGGVMSMRIAQLVNSASKAVCNECRSSMLQYLSPCFVVVSVWGFQLCQLLNKLSLNPCNGIAVLVFLFCRKIQFSDSTITCALGKLISFTCCNGYQMTQK